LKDLSCVWCKSYDTPSCLGEKTDHIISHINNMAISSANSSNLRSPARLSKNTVHVDCHNPFHSKPNTLLLELFSDRGRILPCNRDRPGRFSSSRNKNDHRMLGYRIRWGVPRRFQLVALALRAFPAIVLPVKFNGVQCQLESSDVIFSRVRRLDFEFRVLSDSEWLANILLFAGLSRSVM
jgi:hypothetical protein